MRLDAPPLLRAASFQSVPGVVHGFLGRRGGASQGPWASLNLSHAVGDDADAVSRNWAGVRSLFADLSIITMRQVHGNEVVCIDRPDQALPPADGLVTAVAGVGLGVLTADCVPILMIAPRARVAAAVHAGWRGTLAGIAQVALERLRGELGVAVSDLLVALGPAIDGCCYEVAVDIGNGLEDRWGPMPDAWSRHGDRGRLNLRRANRRILIASGVPPDAIEDVGPCTACQPEDYFSHRGAGGRAGRQLSVVGWR